MAALDKQKMDGQSFEAIVISITTKVLRGCGVKTLEHPDDNV
jgi:TetR/AcrR family transcriptional regulator